MRDYDPKMHRRGGLIALVGFLALFGAPVGFAFLVEIDGVWSLTELTMLVVTALGLVATIWGVVISKRSGATMSRGFNPDGTPQPASAQWAAVTIVTGFALGGLFILRAMNGTLGESTTLVVGALALPLFAWLWFRAVRDERAGRDTDR
ncbi:hypothetical protein [Jannaschia pohangensis]|uniref:Uncharacterized protein n=1 Tax=Jannaschia pohangensis TaxID=390807 RepID=A0A1I3S082_9RHOB|nr:hypothetical protein [Jannaschia pohangensis]SFJ50951.1 hypothetical protein SAMN04488095_2933 [Jannaschia pohangensis]